MKLILRPPAANDVVQLLRAWRFWLLGAIVGSLAGGGMYYAAPPPYRASATVIVDFHLEQAWPQSTDREQFYYLEREVRKLEEVAMSDTTLGLVASQAPGITVQQMRAGVLGLSQPGNGGWHFYANDDDPVKAASLASAWAQAFATQVRAQITASEGGLEPYITATVAQARNLPLDRVPGLGIYVLAGAGIMLTLGALGYLFLDVRT
jgi:hypothetical protein